jgi:hypothetical protein
VTVETDLAADGRHRLVKIRDAEQAARQMVAEKLMAAGARQAARHG